jgi:hypothetical protein
MAFQTLAIGFVMSIEGKYGCGKIADFIHPNYHERIGFIKDIAAGCFCRYNSNNYRFNHIRATNFLSISTQSRMAKTTKKEPLDKKTQFKS